jgi:hypothetical protein
LEFSDDATVELGADPGRDHAGVKAEGVGALALKQGGDRSSGGTGKFAGGGGSRESGG